MRLIEVEADYSQIGLLDAKFSQYDVINKVYLEKVFYTFQIDLDIVEIFINHLVELTNNNIQYQLKDLTICEVDYVKD